MVLEKLKEEPNKTIFVEVAPTTSINYDTSYIPKIVQKIPVELN